MGTTVKLWEGSTRRETYTMSRTRRSDGLSLLKFSLLLLDQRVLRFLYV